jgi:DNA-binding CsgD family transcriptional regulator
MSLWKKFQRAFTPEPVSTAFHLDFDLRTTRRLEKLAAEDESTPEEVARNLLLYGLDKRMEMGYSQTRWNTLTSREREVTALTCLGMTNPEIAGHLKISPDTVRDHVRHALSKFDLHRKAQLREALNDWDFSLWLE